MEYTITERIQKLQGCAGNDRTRPMLTGIYFDSSHVMATDGHKAVIAKKPKEHPENIIIKFKSEKQGKACNGQETYRELDSETLIGTDVKNTAIKIDAEYPDVKCVQPATIEGWESMSLDAGLLLDLANALNDGHREKKVRIYFQKDMAGLMVIFGNEVDRFGILMPSCRVIDNQAELDAQQFNETKL